MLKRFDRHGDSIGTINEYVTNDEGKLNIIGNSPVRKLLIPIVAGNYYFFVSKYKISNPALKINRKNCIRLEITEEVGQRIYLPWPMCNHSFDGAEYIAEYIVKEIQNNAESDKVKTIRYYNDLEKRLEEYNKLPLITQTIMQPPQPMKIEAYTSWVMMVGQGRPWDHKPEILEKFANVAVYRVINPVTGNEGSKYYHKYKNYDYFYDIWSNIHYGYIGKSCGFSDSELLDGAGQEQLVSDLREGRVIREKPENSDIKSPRRFDTITDRKMISLGIILFNKTAGDATKLTKQAILNELERISFKDEGRVIHDCYDSTPFTMA
jgi:hypothetical protein